jgi:hypothetical protein
MADDGSDVTIRLERSGFEEPQKHDFFLGKARQAEQEAAKAANPEIREHWQKIAEGYRKLAGPSPACQDAAKSDHAR